MKSFLLSRLRGEAPLGTVFWRDMLGWGTALNVAFAAAGLGMLASGFSPLAALPVLFAPLPVNVFLLVCVWRSAVREGGPASATAKVVAVLWFLVMVAL